MARSAFSITLASCKNSMQHTGVHRLNCAATGKPSSSAWDLVMLPHFVLFRTFKDHAGPTPSRTSIIAGRGHGSASLQSRIRLMLTTGSNAMVRAHCAVAKWLHVLIHPAVSWLIISVHMLRKTKFSKAPVAKRILRTSSRSPTLD